MHQSIFAVSVRTAFRRCVPKRLQSSKAEQEYLAYMRKANSKMKEYHDTKVLMRQGKLKPHKNNIKQREPDITHIQAGLLVVFLGLFVLTPFIGKKAATDPEFKKKYIPSWYDFTVPEPENPWTRQELHEQMVAVEKHLVHRAAKGDFSDEKLKDLEVSLRDEREQSWDRLHPGISDDDDVND